eukprot:COSAG01_NODE_6922_length_3438_cov_3.977838_2_plen_69_part_00
MNRRGSKLGVQLLRHGHALVPAPRHKYGDLIMYIIKHVGKSQSIQSSDQRTYAAETVHFALVSNNAAA